jgi:phage gpG-like protein
VSEAQKGLQSVFYGQDVTGGMRQLSADLRKSRRTVTMAILSVLQGQVREELSTPGRGRIRRHRVKRSVVSAKSEGRKGFAVVSDIGKAGRASAPGDPPAPDTGKLRGSIQIEYDDVTQRGRMGTNDKRALALNYGTVKAGKSRKVVILPRPFMEPGLKKAIPAMTAAGMGQAHNVIQSRRKP